MSFSEPTPTEASSKMASEITHQPEPNRYASILNKIPQPVCYLDKDLAIVFSNDAFQKLVPKISTEDVQPIFPLLIGTDQFLSIKKYVDTAWQGSEVSFRWDVILEKTIYHFDATITADIHQSGDVMGLIVTLFDKKTTEVSSNLMMDSESKLGHFAAIVHSSSDAIISKTLDGIVTSWNEAAERVFGYTAEEMIGQPIIRLIPKDRHEEEPRILERLKRGEAVEHFETKRITKDGKILDISLTISPVKDSRGNVIGASKIARDITAQINLIEALKTSEERLRIASDSTQLGTWEVIPGTKTIVWSDQCYKIFGLPRDFVLVSEIIRSHILPEYIDEINQRVAMAMDPENENDFDMEYRFTRFDNNELRWLKLRGKVHFDDQKKPVRFVGTMIDVTDEKERDQKIVESSERLRMAIESTKLGTWEYLPISGELSWSDHCREIYGMPADHPLALDVFVEFLHPEDQELAVVAIEKALEFESGGVFDEQFRIIRYNDQQVRWVRSQGRAYFNAAGYADRFIGTIFDITEEKREEEELRNSVELFTTMADNVPAMIWMSGDDKFRDFFNKTWLEFTGRSIDEESNEGWLDGVHPEDVDHCIHNYTESHREQKGFYIEYRLRRHDGQYRWVADRSVPRFNLDGSFAGFISACIDIDDQKNFREKIRSSELRLQSISNAAPVGLWMTDMRGMCTFVNETWIQWTGIPFADQLDTGWLEKVLEEDKLDAPSKFQEAMMKGEKYSTEFRIQRADGDIRWCLTEGSPYYSVNGEIAGYAGSVTDITDFKRMEERKDDFIKMASHELKTPITSIKGYVQLLLNIYNETNEEKFQAARSTVRSSLQTISKQVSKLTRLISELLDLSRIESGKLELYRTEFRLEDLVEEIVQEVRYTTNNHALIIHNDFEGKIIADRDRLSQVILNLLTNAIKYSPESDKVEVYIRREKSYACVSVADYGIGIDSKDHDRIFERFYRVEGKNEQTFPGFGIGLFIATEIVNRHGGTLDVKSTKGKGSVFTMKLPFEIQ